MFDLIVRVLGIAFCVFIAGALFALGSSVALDLREWLAEKPSPLAWLREWWERRRTIRDFRAWARGGGGSAYPASSLEGIAAPKTPEGGPPTASRGPSVRKIGEDPARPGVWIGDPGGNVRG